jgi:hypothetical protein
MRLQRRVEHGRKIIIADAAEIRQAKRPCQAVQRMGSEIEALVENMGILRELAAEWGRGDHRCRARVALAGAAIQVFAIASARNRILKARCDSRSNVVYSKFA